MALATLTQSTSTLPLAGLNVFVSAEGGATVIALQGEADLATLPAIVHALARVIADRDDDVEVDLASLTFLDTATVRALLQAREVLDKHGRQLALRSPSKSAGRLLALFGVSHLVINRKER